MARRAAAGPCPSRGAASRRSSRRHRPQARSSRSAIPTTRPASSSPTASCGRCSSAARPGRRAADEALSDFVDAEPRGRSLALLDDFTRGCSSSAPSPRPGAWRACAAATRSAAPAPSSCSSGSRPTLGRQRARPGRRARGAAQVRAARGRSAGAGRGLAEREPPASSRAPRPVRRIAPARPTSSGCARPGLAAASWPTRLRARVLVTRAPSASTTCAPDRAPAPIGCSGRCGPRLRLA